VRNRKLTLFLVGFIASLNISATEFHVAKIGSDNNPGSATAPYVTIQAAADVALPGDVITVHEGIYRERITPPRGGESDSKRIIYQAAPGERVEIKGSEVIRNWEEIAPDVWKTSLSNSFFGPYNPYIDLICGDWFNDRGRSHHTGEVYLNGKSLWEADSLGKVLIPVEKSQAFDPEGSTFTWYCESDDENTYIYANFQGAKPNVELVEINVRNSCFYPAQTGINYITIRGFHMSQAATQWAAPTAEQIGLIGTFWSKGWIIENNVISDSKCSGITLGKDRETGHNAWSMERAKGGATIYNEVILKALKKGWSKENIGSHLVRNNTIFNCEQTGMCGSLGAAFSTITGNHIYNIWRKRQFSGAEIGAIKFHAAIDVIISHNCLHDANKGMWMDWMTQGTRITSNVCYNNDFADLFSEVNHGPYLVDNNIFMSGIQNWSQGGAFVHNIIAGKTIINPVRDRYTPYHVPHSTELMGVGNIACGDDRIYNNIYIATDYDITTPGKPYDGYGLEAYNQLETNLPVFTGSNLYYNGAKPYQHEADSVKLDAFDPGIAIIEEGGSIYLKVSIDEALKKIDSRTITSESLGIPLMVNHRYENRDGSALVINKDYFGQARDPEHPTVGPFENPGEGDLNMKVWEKLVLH
jgi:hypothetical protein